MSTSIFALLLNAFILAGIVIFLHNYTAYLGKNPGIETYRVMVYKIMQYATYVTQTGFQTGVTLLFGFLMSTEKGFTLSGYGFLQTEHFSKLSFASNLSLQNKWRSFLQKLAVVFVVMDMLLVFTIFIATRLNSTDVSILNAIVPCIYFTQSGSTPYERYWPTFQVESGVGEFVFGSSLGYMRSEMAVNYTTAIFPPTIISSVNNGDSLQGPGFTVDIFSHCECAVTSDLSTFLRK